MKNKMKMLLITSLLLFPSSIALADEGHSDINKLSEDMEKIENIEHSEESSHEGHTMTPEEHENMTDGESSTHNESEKDNYGTNHTDSTTHKESSEKGGHGHGVVEETPPNYKVLSVFGAINFSFLFVGLWKKRMRKKVDINVDAGKKD